MVAPAIVVVWNHISFAKQDRFPQNNKCKGSWTTAPLDIAGVRACPVVIKITTVVHMLTWIVLDLCLQNILCKWEFLTEGVIWSDMIGLWHDRVICGKMVIGPWDGASILYSWSSLAESFGQ